MGTFANGMACALSRTSDTTKNKNQYIIGNYRAHQHDLHALPFAAYGARWQEITVVRFIQVMVMVMTMTMMTMMLMPLPFAVHGARWQDVTVAIFIQVMVMK